MWKIELVEITLRFRSVLVGNHFTLVLVDDEAQRLRAAKRAVLAAAGRRTLAGMLRLQQPQLLLMQSILDEKDLWHRDLTSGAMHYVVTLHYHYIEVVSEPLPCSAVKSRSRSRHNKLQEHVRSEAKHDQLRSCTQRCHTREYLASR